MDVKMFASQKLKSLQYDFGAFSLDSFIAWIEKNRDRKIYTFAWKMPPNIFAAWFSDGEYPIEYIFYRDDVPVIHQVHIQLHELAHLLLDHPTLNISKDILRKSFFDQDLLPIENLKQLRSSQVSQYEKEAEILASLIQEQVIQHSNLRRLTEGGSSNAKLASFLQNLGMNG